jgi:hypothetical protein
VNEADAIETIDAGTLEALIFVSCNVVVDDDAVDWSD